MSLLQILGIALLCGILTVFLKDTGSKFTPLLTVFGGVLLLSFFLFRIAPTFSLVTHYLEAYQFNDKGGLLVKALAVGYLTQIGGDTCRDLGADGIASKLELCGRAELLLLTLPTLTELLNVAFALVNP